MKKKKHAKSKKSSNKTTHKKTSCCSSQSWMITSIVLAILLLASVLFGFTNILGGEEETAMTQKEAETRAEEFMDLLGALEGVPLDISSVVEENNLYKVSADFTGQETVFYMTTDGELLFLQGISLEELNEFKAQMDLMMQQENVQAQAQISEHSTEEINTLVSCLAGKDFKIYGADWCGYTDQVTDLFNGADISEIYVECTVEEALCAQEGITGYPTIKLDGESANVGRSLSAFADATGCAI